jgi:hypothetical protein
MARAGSGAGQSAPGADCPRGTARPSPAADQPQGFFDGFAVGWADPAGVPEAAGGPEGAGEPDAAGEAEAPALNDVPGVDVGTAVPDCPGEAVVAGDLLAAGESDRGPTPGRSPAALRPSR